MAAKDLLQLIRAKPVPLFNPLIEESDSMSIMNSDPLKENSSSVRGHSSSNPKNEMAVQLFNAIYLVIVAWDADPDTKLYFLLAKAKKYLYCSPYIDRIIAVNNIIKKDAQGRKLSEIIRDLEKNNPGCRFKKFSFNLLDGELKKIKLSPFFKLKQF